MIETALVVARRGELVDVVTTASEACARCGACSSGDSTDMLLRDVADSVGASVGDTVEIEMPERLRAQAALAIYVVPIVALLVGYVAGSSLGRRAGFDPDLSGAVAAVLFISVAFFGVRRAESAVARSSKGGPAVRAIIARGSTRSDSRRGVDGQQEVTFRE
ncbi:MAG TPA: SoxR reducing system RseC family protein [Coriobacteriia bacterium]|nr:SoxR reducing system RseC family protein [Coriobacteriia bacterium]